MSKIGQKRQKGLLLEKATRTIRVHNEWLDGSDWLNQAEQGPKVTQVTQVTQVAYISKGV